MKTIISTIILCILLTDTVLGQVSNKSVGVITHETDSVITNLQNRIIVLEKERDYFRTYYIKEVKRRLPEDEKYLLQSFKDITIDNLEDLDKKYQPCIHEDSAFSNIIRLIEQVNHNKRIYECISHFFAENAEPYSVELSRNTIHYVDSFISPLSDIQESEVEILTNLFQIYPKTITTFQNRINSIREQLDRGTCIVDKDFTEGIKSIILPDYFESNKQEMSNDYDFRYSEIPWIKVRYDKWFKSIQEDFMSQETIQLEDQILSLQIVETEEDINKDLTKAPESTNESETDIQTKQ
jgi:hypothetical protein